MATDNRTNGQIVAKALVAHCEDHKMPFPRGSIKKIVEALRVAGRLAGEPTEAQVEAAEAERDAALARIAELEQSLRSESLARMVGTTLMHEYERRFAEAAELHRKYTYYEHEDSCPDTSEKHREDHHHESDEIGEFYCDQMPTGDVACDNCRDVNGDRMEWPCPTIAALYGAPETEWEVQYGRRNRETGALHWLTGDPRDDWWHENQDRYEHVKRYTSPPLPVEGEIE